MLRLKFALFLLPVWAVVVCAAPIAAIADTQPVRPLPRRGGCPSEYSSWDAYCLPGSTARGAIERIGAYCPRGFETSGEYCVAYPKAKEAIPKVGYTCPPGWDNSGAYCLSP